MKFSIIICTYNSAKRLPKTLDSILAQTSDDFEVVVIDGASSDGIQDVINSYENKFVGKLRWISEKDTGVYNAMNKGIRMAKGEYLNVIGAGDWLEKDALEQANNCIEKHPDIDAVYGVLRMWDKNLEKEFLVQTYPDMLLTQPMQHPALYYKKSLHDRFGLYDESYKIVADYVFCTRAFYLGNATAQSFDAVVDNYILDGISSDAEKCAKENKRARVEFEILIKEANEKEVLDKILGGDTLEVKREKERIFREEFLERTTDIIREKNSEIAERKKLLAQKDQEIKQKEWEIQQNNQEIQQKNQEIDNRDQELFEIRSTLRWKVPTYLYKLYKNKAKKFVPRLVFDAKDIFLLVFNKIIFNIKKVNIKRIKRSIIQGDPHITIGIASYNHSRYLEKCIESALGQTYKKFDIVIVDDNSSDEKNREILKKYEKNPKIKIIYKKINEGISASLNDQILYAPGEWVAFLDCDDYLPGNALEEMAKYIKSNPHKELVFSNRIEVDPADKFLRKVWFGDRYKEKRMFNELLKGMVSSHLKLISKEAFKRVGLFDPRFGGTHDYDMFLRVAFYMPKSFGFIDKYLYYHRIHEKQNTSVESEKHKKNVEKILKEARLRKVLYDGQFNKKVSIVILSFNRYEQLKNTVENIIKHSKNIENEIIIWDNGSTYEKLLEYLKKIDGKNNVRVVFCETNLMAAEGRKRATELAQGEYVLYFDNDIEVRKNFLEEFIIRIEESDDIASCCAKVVFPDGKIQYTGGLIKKLDEKFISFGLDNVGKDADDLASMQKNDYDWLGSGATMTKRKYLHLATFDPGFLNAYEDNDYYMQFKEKGLRLVHAPTVKVIHHHVKYELKRDPGTKKYVETRHKKDSFIESWAYFYKKWGLIVMDEFILGIAGLADKSKPEIISYLENKEK